METTRVLAAPASSGTITFSFQILRLS
jgi:hypothetical protein